MIQCPQVRCSPLLLFPWARNFTPIAPVCCADGYTTVLLCRVLVDCMSYQGTAEKQYFYTEQSSLLINPLTLHEKGLATRDYYLSVQLP